MYEKGLRILRALQPEIGDLGASISLLERMSSGRVDKRGIQGILNHLSDLAGLARHLALPKRDSLESVLCPDKVRTYILESMHLLRNSVEAMLYANRLLQIQKFNAILWGQWCSRWHSGDPLEVPPVPALNPYLLEYLQRQLQMAIIWLPADLNIGAFPVPLAEDLNFVVGPHCKLLPEPTVAGWYAVEKISPCHFGRMDRDDLARVMGFSSRSLAWQEIQNRRVPEIAEFFGLPRESVSIPSWEELALFFLLSDYSELMPGRAGLNMLGEFSCRFWFDSNNFEVCRNQVAETEPARKRDAFRRHYLVAGGCPADSPDWKTPRQTFSVVDTEEGCTFGFRIMINLEKCVGVKFEPSRHPPFYEYD